jgi:NAD(P)-dependent dehydrogenase (short-subunit alcohol dehydrogenase family)
VSARDISTFGARTTAAETLEGIDLGGRTALVTGASSGIGVETARALAGAGATVTLAVRDVAPVVPSPTTSPAARAVERPTSSSCTSTGRPRSRPWPPRGRGRSTC